MSCADDPGVLSDAVIAARAARAVRAGRTGLARAAAASRRCTWSAPKCPTPGGAQKTLEALAVTDAGGRHADHRARTAARFSRRDWHDAWARVVGTGGAARRRVRSSQGDRLRPRARRGARPGASSASRNLVYEAHSTDYQTPAALAALVRDHFAILKVGPGVTFALRESVLGAGRDRARIERRAGAAAEAAGPRRHARRSTALARLLHRTGVAGDSICSTASAIASATTGTRRRWRLPATR